MRLHVCMFAAIRVSLLANLRALLPAIVLMARRYSYTPRRTGSPPKAGTVSIPILPIVIGLAVLLFGGWLLFRGGSPGVVEPDNAALALPPNESATPAAVASAQATPRKTPKPAPVPVISGLGVTVLEEPCGAVLYASNEHTSVPPASLAKIVTALVAVDHGNLDRKIAVTVDGSALALETDATVMGLRPGQRLSMTDLLYGLLMRSGNDAALQIAEAISGDEASFVALMNAKVAELGLTDTHFTNSHGMDAAGLYTSAYDMAMLGHELLKDPLLAKIVGTQKYKPGWDGPEIENLNLMLTGYKGSVGIKTGYTDQAGQTIVAAAEDTGRVLIVSVLKSENRYRDAGRLLDWGFESTAPAC